MVTNYEKIATIYQSHVRGVSWGAFGKAVDSSHNTSWRARIEVAGGPCVLVRGSVIGWQVSFKGFIAEDADLEHAARMALEAGEGVSVTRNYRLG